MQFGDSDTAPSDACHCAGVLATIERACTGLPRQWAGVASQSIARARDSLAWAGQDAVQAGTSLSAAWYRRSCSVMRLVRDGRRRGPGGHTKPQRSTHPLNSSARMLLTIRWRAISFWPSKASEITTTLKCVSEPLGTLWPEDSLRTWSQR